MINTEESNTIGLLYIQIDKYDSLCLSLKGTGLRYSYFMWHIAFDNADN